MFFNVRIVTKSPAELSPPIGAFMELRSNANLPRLVKSGPKASKFIKCELIWEDFLQ